MAIADAETEDREISRTMQILGGTKSVGETVRNRLEAHEVIQKGFKAGVLEHLRKQFVILDAPRDLKKALGLSIRTYQRHKKAPDEPGAKRPSLEIRGDSGTGDPSSWARRRTPRNGSSGRPWH